MLYKREPTQAEKDRMFYSDMRKSDECICGKYKQPGYAFCFKCYAAIPEEMKPGLYRAVGDGFEAAYEAANRYLNEI